MKDAGDATAKKTLLKNMLTDLAAASGKTVEFHLRLYTEFVGSDGTKRWAQSVDELSDAWAVKTLP